MRSPPLTLCEVQNTFTDVYVLVRTLDGYSGAHQKCNIGPGEALGRSRNPNTQLLRYRRI